MSADGGPEPAAGPAPPGLLARRPLHAIVSLAAPTTAVMFIAAASNVFHTYFVSRLGDDSIAAVSLVFPIALIMFTVVSGGLGAGTSSAIARALGGGRAGEARALAEHAFGLTLLVAVAATAASELGVEPLFRAMGGGGAVLAQATLFARTLFSGLLITFTVGTFDSIMRAEGNVRIPALCATLSLLLQIAFTPLFMFVAGLGLVGAPLATLAGQLIGAVPRAVYIFGGHGGFRPRLLPRAIDGRHVAEIVRVGVPAALAAGLNFVVLIILTGTLARFGTAHLAGYGLGTRLDFLLFSLGFGVALASLTLVGMATGAGRRDLVVRYVTQATLLVAGVVAVPALLVVWRPELWIGIFTRAPEILAVGTDYFRVIGPSYLFAVTSMVIASAFQGLGRATIPLTVMIGRVIVVVAAALTATNLLGAGAHAVFVIIAAGNVGSCLALAALFRRTVASESLSDPLSRITCGRGRG